ncbi:Cilia- and flagella-associated protein 221 [Boothiomyces sp. JEL0838]|nr:Cilia- and flagella-associated protein 221 [Boothiomyces sp. JEL0838]
MVSIEPSTLLFPFDEISTDSQPIEFTKIIKLRNVGVSKTRFGIHILEQSEFTVIQQKTGAIYPGEFEIIKVKFSPKSWSVSQGKIYVNASKQGDMMPVTLKAFPVLSKIDIPKSIDFGPCLIYEPQVKKISLFNDLSIDFEYTITIDEELPPNYFTISPQKGILTKMETKEISIIFSPLTLCQAQMQFTINISQEEFTPVSCRLYGTGDLTLPERPKKTVKKKKKLDKLMHGFVLKSKSVLASIEDTRKKPCRNTEELDLFELELQNNNTGRKKVDGTKTIQSNKVDAISIPELPHVHMEIIKCQKPPKNYAVSKKMDIVVPEVPELVTKVLIPPTEPSFTDKIGWHPLNVPKQDRYLEIEVPPLQFERNSSSTLTLDEEQIQDALPNVSQVPMDIYPSTFAKSSIYNPVPGVMPLLYDFQNIHDESSAHYVFHSQNPHNYNGYKKLVELENELRLKIHEMDSTFFDTYDLLHNKK